LKEVKPADFQILLKRRDLKKIAALKPEQKRRLYEYPEKCEYILANFKDEIYKAIED